MCSKCNACVPGERVNPEEELWVLCEQAFVKYQDEVINGGKLYHRYVNDFISYNLPIASNNITDWQYHSMNLSKIHELLTNRLDLIDKYFTKTPFSREAFADLFNEFSTNLGDSVPISSNKKSSNEELIIKNNNRKSLGVFSHEQLCLITDKVNKAHIFISEVTVDDMDAFFNCTLTTPLVLADGNIGRFAIFMDRLRDTGLVSHCWQSTIHNFKLLAYKSPSKVIKKSNLRTNLCEYRRRHFLEFAGLSNEILKIAYDSLDKK